MFHKLFEHSLIINITDATCIDFISLLTDETLLISILYHKTFSYLVFLILKIRYELRLKPCYKLAVRVLLGLEPLALRDRRSCFKPSKHSCSLFTKQYITIVWKVYSNNRKKYITCILYSHMSAGIFIN